MNVYKKLIDARLRLQAKPMKKSGHNKFAGYQYFELGDFLPEIQKIFHEVGLVDTISFTPTMAEMNIYDVEDGSFITFTSPMGSAALKGCHEVQNIGACETYQRRYLYVTALAIVEHDALEATTGAVEPVKKEVKPAVEIPTIPRGTVAPKNIEGEAGYHQIVITPPTQEHDQVWLNDCRKAVHLLLDTCVKEADVMTIFKKNKVLFDTVKQMDPAFFKDMMVKFTETKEKLANKE